MIDLRFGLFWSGAPLSYLRYMTFKTLRHHHPEAEIDLYVSLKSKKDGFYWNCEQQDFQINKDGECYLDRLKDLNVNVSYIDTFSQYPPNFQSDFFRWWYLKKYGGFYLDTDQIVLKPFDTLPLDSDIIVTLYKAKSCGTYAPVGAIGANKDSEIVDWVDKLLPQFYEPNNYNSLGPFMFRTILGMRAWKDKIYNAPSNVFYPVPDSYLVPSIYDGTVIIPDDAYCVHWFGGHPASQKFNKGYSEESAKNGDDFISKHLREAGLVTVKVE